MQLPNEDPPTPGSRPDRQRLAEVLLRHGDADATAATGAVISVLDDIVAALVPILGPRGVGALYRRCLHLAAATHPWLPVAGDPALASMALAPLREALAAHTPSEAAAAGADLLIGFHDLLASLVGASLAARLLHGVWAALPGDPASQDTAP